MIKRILPLLAIALAAMFFAIALYINMAEQPARLSLPDGPLLAQWKVSFSVGFMMQGSLTIVAGVIGLLTWWFHRDWKWIAGGLLMLANWPWTLLVIAPVNTALLAIAPDAAGPESRALIEHWGQVHSGRTIMSLLALAVFIWAALHRPADH